MHLPSQAISIANNVANNASPAVITYGEATDAIVVDYYEFGEGIMTVYVNPYDGAIVKCVEKSVGKFDFSFRFVLNGHRRLWLRVQIREPIVGISAAIYNNLNRHWSNDTCATDAYKVYRQKEYQRVYEQLKRNEYKNHCS